MIVAGVLIGVIVENIELKHNDLKSRLEQIESDIEELKK